MSLATTLEVQYKVDWLEQQAPEGFRSWTGAASPGGHHKARSASRRTSNTQVFDAEARVRWLTTNDDYIQLLTSDRRGVPPSWGAHLELSQNSACVHLLDTVNFLVCLHVERWSSQTLYYCINIHTVSPSPVPTQDGLYELLSLIKVARHSRRGRFRRPQI